MGSLPFWVRRSSRAFSIALAGLGVALAPFASAQSMFRGDAAHSGRGNGDGPASLKGVKWSFKTGGAVVASPVIADGALFVGSDDKAVYALDLATGTQKWKSSTGGLVRSTPAVMGGVVYVGSYDGSLYALDATTGAARWKFETEGERKFSAKGLHGGKPAQQVAPDAWDCFLSSPVVADGRVYFGSGDGNVYALTSDTGKLAWKFATGNVVHASPALAHGTVFIGSWDTFLYALDAATGAVKWKFKTGEDAKNHNQEGIQSSACVADGVVYFGCRDSHLYAVDAKTGMQKWKYKLTWINASPTVRDGRVYASSSIPAFLFAVDAATGKEVFKVDLKSPSFSSPAIAGERAYVGSFNGRLYAVDLPGKKVAWEFQTEASRLNARQALSPDGKLNSPVLFPNDFFEQMVIAVDALFSSGAIVSSPAVDRGVVYVGSADGSVYALE